MTDVNEDDTLRRRFEGLPDDYAITLGDTDMIPAVLGARRTFRGGIW